MNNSVDQGFCIIDEHGQEKEMLQEQTIKPIIITGTTTKTTTGRYNLRRRHYGKAVTAKNTPNPLNNTLLKLRSTPGTAILTSCEEKQG